MTSFETLIHVAIGNVAEEFTDLFSSAQGDALRSLKPISNAATRTVMAPLMLRAQLCNNLSGRNSLDTPGWEVRTDPRHMMSITFTNQELNARFKLLKERTAVPGGVPNASLGTERSLFWNPGLFEIEDAPQRLLFLFDVIGFEDDSDWETPLRVVRATGLAPHYGARVPIDLSIPVTSEPGFYARRPFETGEEVDLFASIRRDDNERAV